MTIIKPQKFSIEEFKKKMDSEYYQNVFMSEFEIEYYRKLGFPIYVELNRVNLKVIPLPRDFTFSHNDIEMNFFRKMFIKLNFSSKVNKKYNNKTRKIVSLIFQTEENIIGMKLFLIKLLKYFSDDEKVYKEVISFILDCFHIYNESLASIYYYATIDKMCLILDIFKDYYKIYYDEKILDIKGIVSLF